MFTNYSINKTISLDKKQCTVLRTSKSIATFVTQQSFFAKKHCEDDMIFVNKKCISKVDNKRPKTVPNWLEIIVVYKLFVRVF